MELKSNTFNKILFILTVVPAIFQDLPAGNLFGTIARSPVVFIAPIIFFLLVIIGGKFKLEGLSKYYINYYIITVITSIVMMLIVVIFFTDGNWYAYNEFFPAKLFKASQYTLIFFFFVYNAFWLIDKLQLSFVLNVFQGTLFFMLLYGCLEFLDPYPVRFIHSVFIEEWKTRLVLTGPEPSTTMLIFYCVAFCAIALRIFLKKNRLFTIILILVSLFMLLAIGSKSGVAFIVLSLVWVLRKHFSIKFFAISILISIPVVYYFIAFIIPDLLSDIDDFTSFSTRTTTILVAFKSLFIFPIGQGYGTYIYYFPQMLLPMNKFLSDALSIPLLDYELEDMVNTGKYLGVKSGIFQEVLYSGFIAVFFYYKVFKKYFEQVDILDNDILKIIFLMGGCFCLIELLLTTELLTAYYYLFPFIVLHKIVFTTRFDSL